MEGPAHIPYTIWWDGLCKKYNTPPRVTKSSLLAQDFSSLKTAAAAAKSLQSCPTLCDPIDGKPTRLPHPWDSPGKNTGVGCRFLLQCLKVKSESEVAQPCLTQRPHGVQPTRLLRPCDFTGKSTGVECHCLLPKPHRPGEYEVPVSTGFSVVTKHGHKVAASLPAPLLGFLLFVF